MTLPDFCDLHNWVLADISMTDAGVMSDSDSGKNDGLEWRIAESFASRNKSFIFFPLSSFSRNDIQLPSPAEGEATLSPHFPSRLVLGQFSIYYLFSGTASPSFLLLH